MDLPTLVAQLREELRLIDEAIARVEVLVATKQPRGRSLAKGRPAAQEKPKKTSAPLASK